VVSSARSVAIIGAGLAGAAAAHRLAAAGLNVLIIEKGRGVGGRMATRRSSESLTFDHGAQYFTARDPRFSALIEGWVAVGLAAAWGAEPGWFVGTPTMTAPARALTRDSAVLTGCTVARLQREAGVWHLMDGAGQSVAEGRAFDALLVTAPAPQTVALLATTDVGLPELERVRYAPCWALLFAHDGPSPMTEPARLDPDPAAPLAWVAQNHTKPGRAREPATLVAHAAPAWSRRHLEHDPAEIVDMLQGELARIVDLAMPPARYAAAHRWRYALVEQAIGEPCLWRPEIGLGFAGDGCLGGRVEAAYLSGLTLAERVLADV
jgi:renalase